VAYIKVDNLFKILTIFNNNWAETTILMIDFTWQPKS